MIVPNTSSSVNNLPEEGKIYMQRIINNDKLYPLKKVMYLKNRTAVIHLCKFIRVKTKRGLSLDFKSF